MKKTFKQIKNNNGITLIALVITIIVLLILAGVTIVTLTGDNGLLQKATNVKEENEQAKELELIKLAVASAQVAGNGILTTENLNTELTAAFNDTSEEVELIQDYWICRKYKIEQSGKIEELLPKAYQQVKYIESSGQQYIDTKFLANTTTTRYETKINISSSSGTTGIFGSRNDYTDGSACCFIIDNTIRLDWMQGSTSYKVPILTDNDYTINITRGTAIINGTTYTCDNTASIDQNYNFLIGSFTNQSVNPYNNNFLGKIYYSKLYSNNKLIYNFVPCKRKEDNKPGLFDLISNVFYTNQGKSDDFIVGPEV